MNWLRLAREYAPEILMVFAVVGVFGWWTHAQRLRGMADAYAAEASAAIDSVAAVERRAEAASRIAARDSARADSLAAEVEQRRRVAEAALDSLRVVSRALEVRVRASVPDTALPAFDSLVTTHRAEVDTLRGVIASQDRLLGAQAAALASARAELQAERDVSARLREALRLRDEEVRALRGSVGAGLWDRAKWAGAGALVGVVGGMLAR